MRLLARAAQLAPQHFHRLRMALKSLESLARIEEM
jgi:hypothetical protein